MKKTIITIATLACLLLSGCYSGNDTIDVLSKDGYTNIETHGHAFFACGKDDSFATKFTATSPVGNKVSGAVCSGWFKGKTVRFD